MNGAPDIRARRLVIASIIGLAAILSGCERKDTGLIQGYVEGEFVYVASPGAGAVKKLSVQRGDQVKEGDPLYTLEGDPESSTRDEAARRLAQAKATLEDARKGRRPTEMEALQAQLEQARAAADLSAKELARQEQLAESGATSKDDVDRARSNNEQNVQRVAQLGADIKTARLGQRTDQIVAAEAEVHARESALARAEWELTQKQQSAPKAGLISDTLYREGEWVAAGRPVVVLLPPQNIKVRAFVPEKEIGPLQVGQSVKVFVDGFNDPIGGRVSFISPQSEFTPPVIYSRETRSKLVFMIEIVFDRELAAKLHPGQPVDVQLHP